LKYKSHFFIFFVDKEIFGAVAALEHVHRWERVRRRGKGREGRRKGERGKGKGERGKGKGGKG
jgi:hypothetical protein